MNFPIALVMLGVCGIFAATVATGNVRELGLIWGLVVITLTSGFAAYTYITGLEKPPSKTQAGRMVRRYGKAVAISLAALPVLVAAMILASLILHR